MNPDVATAIRGQEPERAKLVLVLREGGRGSVISLHPSISGQLALFSESVAVCWLDMPWRKPVMTFALPGW